MNAANINVIQVGRTEVAMPASATVAQRGFVRGWLTGLEIGPEADVVAEKIRHGQGNPPVVPRRGRPTPADGDPGRARGVGGRSLLGA